VGIIAERDGDVPLRAEAAAVLADVGALPTASVQQLATVLVDATTPPDVLEPAIRAAERSGSPVLVQGLVSVMSDRSQAVGVRVAAAGALRTKPPSAAAAEALMAVCSEPAPEVRGPGLLRAQAASTLWFTAMEGLQIHSSMADPSRLNALLMPFVEATGKQRAATAELVFRVAAAGTQVPLLDAGLGAASAEVRASAIQSISAMPDEAKTMMIDRLVKALHDDDVRVQRSAAAVLSEIPGGADAGEPLLTAILNDMYMQERWESPSAPEVRNLGTGIAGSIVGLAIQSGISRSAPELRLPTVWSKPPRASAHDDITNLVAALMGRTNATLGQVQERLIRELHATGFDEVGTIAAPGGFGLVTKVERIREDGTPFDGSRRWSSEKLGLETLSLTEYLKRLFFERPGQFRLLVFLVSSGYEFADEKERLAEKEARTLTVTAARGALPEDLAKGKLAGLRCHVLVYHFEKKASGAVRVLLPSAISARDHLVGARLWNRFQIKQ
jgi:HEAT repeat protein